MNTPEDILRLWRESADYLCNMAMEDAKTLSSFVSPEYIEGRKVRFRLTRKEYSRYIQDKRFAGCLPAPRRKALALPPRKS